MKKWIAAIVAVIGVSGLPAPAPADGGGGAARRQAEILHMVRQDCGSCHGMTMKGGLGPPLVPAALAEKDDEQMLFVILNGRHGTPMPPWRPFLSEAEARWVLHTLKQGLPDAR